MSGFRAVGEIAARLVAVVSRCDLPVGGCVATVLVAEGCGQVIWHRGEPGLLFGQTLFNDFTAPGMGAQLRALADAVDAAQALVGQGGD